MSNPYEISDRASRLLNRKAIRRFSAAKQKAVQLGFDELNVIQICRDLYESLSEDNRKAFLALAEMAYKQADPHGKEEDFELWMLNEVLGRPNDVTHYTYTHEVDRKRDRLSEAVNSVQTPGKAKITLHGKAPKATTKTMEFQRALRLWARMTAEYADIVTDEATLKAYKDAGVKRVIWHTEEDDKVCDICGPRDRQVYDIDKVPVKPHWGCRCWLEAEKE